MVAKAAILVIVLFDIAKDIVSFLFILKSVKCDNNGLAIATLIAQTNYAIDIFQRIFQLYDIILADIIEIMYILT